MDQLTSDQDAPVEPPQHHVFGRLGAALVAASIILTAFWPHFDILSGTCWPAVTLASLVLYIAGFALVVRYLSGGWLKTLSLVAGGYLALCLVEDVFWTISGPTGRCVVFYVDVPFVG